MLLGQQHPGASGHVDEPLVAFTNYAGTYTGVGPDQREWRISPTLSGWRLEYRDPDDAAWSYSGTHRTLEAAQSGAGRTGAPNP